MAERRHWRKLSMAVGAVALGGLAVAGFSFSSLAKQEPTPSPRDVPKLDGKWIRFSPRFAERAHIAIARVELGSLSPVVGVTGTVSFDPALMAAIGTRISGRVRRVLKVLGDRVQAGEVVAELESAELGRAQAAVGSARASANAAATNERRVTLLAKEHAASQREAELARSTASTATAELVATEQRLRTMGGSATGELGVLQLTSPIAGRLVEINISRGQSVEPTLTAVRVADLRRVWIDLAVFERELWHVHVGDKVEISPQANPQISLDGTVAHVGDIIELDTRSARVRVVVDNAKALLKPGQAVIAKIHTEDAGPGPMVPLDAVTTVDGKPTIFVANDETSVESRAVVLGARDSHDVLVISGLQAGERVVVEGVFALKAEVFR